MKALITGITGQDGSFLAELLLGKGYEVYGVVRRTSTPNTSRISHICHENLKIYSGDLLDLNRMNKIIQEVQPDELYNLAAQSDVQVSFLQPNLTMQINAIGVLGILEATRNYCPKSKVYQASTSELFGGVNPPLKGYSEESLFNPKSPYAVAKLCAYWIVRNYRECYNIFACNGILFNHESERRGLDFVTKKITKNLVEVKKGKRDFLKIGNLNAKRDWGYAREYVEGMWRMLQQDNPGDYVLATGETHTVREFVEISAKSLGYEIVWRGTGIDEKGYDKTTNKLLVTIDSDYFRPSEVVNLIGDASKAKEILGWEAQVKFGDLVKIMIDFDLAQN